MHVTGLKIEVKEIDIGVLTGRIFLTKLAYFDVLSPKLMINLHRRGVAGERCSGYGR